MKTRIVFLLGVTFATVGGCDGENHGHSHGPAASQPASPAVTNRISLPEQVRRNLGVTFAKVESRRVAATLRVPGRFELLPSARREYRSVLPAHVELLVRQYEAVKPGQVLARLQSPEWRRIQHEAIEAEGEITVAEAQVDVAVATKVENEKATALLRRRVAAFAEANARRAELETDLAVSESKVARLDAEVRAARVKLAEAREHFASKLNTLAAVAGVAVEELSAPSPTTAPAGAAAEAPPPRWRSMNAIEVRASQPGVVESLAVTNGGWVDASALILATADPTQLRFRATAFQADLGKLRDGAGASIVAPQGVRAGADDALPGKVTLGLEASPDTRTIELIIAPQKPAAWARPGVSAYAEVVTDGSAAPETAIPLAAVVQDELARIYFRRDPKDPDKVIRMEGDFGVSDGKWVVVNSGLKAGDEVVLDGVYELKLTGSGKPQGGGHFHADGTWHADGTPEPAERK
jgi:HlyD family secretion protein